MGDTSWAAADDSGRNDSGLHLEDHAHSVTATWADLGATPAGEFSSVSISPHDPDQVYLGSDKSGLFISRTLPMSFSREAMMGPSPHVLQPVVELPDAEGSSVSGLSISADGQTLYVGAGMGVGLI